MRTRTKKFLVIAVMLVLLGVTGYLNIALNSSQAIETGAKSTMSFYEKYRTYREDTRNKELAIWEAIASNSKSTTEQVADAQENIKQIRANLAMEFDLETLISTKGFDEVVVSYSSDIINVMVKTEGLTEDQATQILDIVTSTTKKDMDCVKIIPIE